MKANSKIARLVSSILLGAAASTASAQLLDHGPSDPTLIWPLWYRSNDGIALGMCRSQVTSTNAAAGGASMCFPTPFDPAGFAGNVGPELFYNLIDYKQKPGAATNFNFRYLAGLEASYIPGPAPVHGQETVFARIRIAINFNDPSFAGDYTITHPFGVEHFTNVQPTTTGTVQGSQAAVFYTTDVPLGVANDFNAALGGPIGPFIRWDVLNPGENLTVGGEQFLGDPNYPHTFTGSPFIDADGNPQNYIRIDGPPSADFGNGAGVPLIITEANILGQVWTAPIASNLIVDQAVKARSNTTGLNSIDVWATSTPAHKLVLSGAGMPSMQMIEDQTVQGHYHGHIEYPVSQGVPASVTVSDNTSVPIVSVDKQLADSVEISMANYDTNTGVIDVVAHSSDEVNPQPGLQVENIPGISAATAAMSIAACTAAQFAGVNALLEKCFSYTLPSTVEPPKFIAVRSSAGGSHDDQLVMVTGKPQNKTPAPLQGNISLTVNSTGITILPTGTGVGQIPANALIVSQPTKGTLTLVAGQYQFTANTGIASGTDSFKFVVQNQTTGAVSAQAIASLNVVFQPSAPIGTNDQFAAGPARAVKVLNVLVNDKPLTTDAANAINPKSIIVTSGTRSVTAPATGNSAALPTARGSLTVSSAGLINYTPATVGVVDTFTYTVKNVGITGQPTTIKTSTPVTVEVSNFSAAEAISFIKNQYIKGGWTVTPSTTWFGPSLTQTTMSCFLITNNGVAIAPQLIGSSLVDATGKAQIVAGADPVAGPTSAGVRCTTSNGGTATSAATLR